MRAKLSSDDRYSNHTAFEYGIEVQHLVIKSTTYNSWCMAC